MKPNHLPRAVTAFLALALFSGCGTPTRAPSATPNVEANATATPTATPTPTPDANDPANWLISAQGIGPVSIGLPLDQVGAVLPGAVRQDCPGPWFSITEAPDIVASGTWDPVTAAVTILVAQPDAPIPAKTPRTAEGIGIGSTSAEVEAAYPGLLVTDDRWSYYVVPAEGMFIVIRPEDDGIVRTISVTPENQPISEFCA